MGNSNSSPPNDTPTSRDPLATDDASSQPEDKGKDKDKGKMEEMKHRPLMDRNPTQTTQSFDHDDISLSTCATGHTLLPNTSHLSNTNSTNANNNNDKDHHQDQERKQKLHQKFKHQQAQAQSRGAGSGGAQQPQHGNGKRFSGDSPNVEYPQDANAHAYPPEMPLAGEAIDVSRASPPRNGSKSGENGNPPQGQGQTPGQAPEQGTGQPPRRTNRLRTRSLKIGPTDEDQWQNAWEEDSSSSDDDDEGEDDKSRDRLNSDLSKQVDDALGNGEDGLQWETTSVPAPDRKEDHTGTRPNLNMFSQLRVLGKGSFGKVCMFRLLRSIYFAYGTMLPCA